MLLQYHVKSWAITNLLLYRSEENQSGAMIMSVAENRLTIEPVAKRLAAPVHLTEEDMAYPDNTGRPELRKAFARYLEHTQMQVCQDRTRCVFVHVICALPTLKVLFCHVA
jgi:aspartate/methionine/tyrosine aminotransferase